MPSPFSIFRKHQKMLMVVLTGLAMFAFLFLDTLTRQSGTMPAATAMILFAALIGGALWAFGTTRKRGNEYAIVGIILGILVGYLLTSSQAAPAVATNVGSLSDQKLQMLRQKRGLANRFVQQAAQKAGAGARQQIGFGGASDRELAIAFVLRHEARQMGIHVSDDAVNDYIKRVTEDKLAPDDFHEIVRSMNLSESDLYNILREELEVQLARDLLDPPSGSSTFGGLQTPEQYYDYYRKLHVRQQLEVAAVPVEAFTPEIPDPTESELTAFFEAHKNVLPGVQRPGSPGFLQERRVTLTYLEADYETFEGLISDDVSDEEIAGFYEANKEAYRSRAIPDEPGEFAGGAGPAGPADALSPANTTPGEPPDIPADAAVPANRDAQPEAAEDAAAEADTDADEPADEFCGPLALQDATETETDAPAPSGVAAAADRPEAAVADALQPANIAAQPGPALTPPAPREPAAGAENEAALPPEPTPQYRPLDDELKEEIRDQILRERTLAKMSAAVDEARARMNEVAGAYFDAADEQEQQAAAARIAQQLKDFAEARNLRYVETGPLSASELASSTAHPIGSATEQVANPLARQNVRTVTDELFGTEIIYNAMTADNRIEGKKYAYWKTSEIPPHVPTLDEPGVREQVLDAWKIEQARPKAQERARELAEMVRESKEPAPLVLADQTVTGNEDSAPLFVNQTERFSWMETPPAAMMNNPFGLQIPRLSSISVVPDAGEDFMRVVFDQLQNGEVGVAPNADRTVFYVAKVQKRDPAGAREGAVSTSEKALQQQFLNEKVFGFFPFLPTPYDILAAQEFRELQGLWDERLMERYEIRIAGEPAAESAGELQ